MGPLTSIWMLIDVTYCSAYNLANAPFNFQILASYRNTLFAFLVSVNGVYLSTHHI